MGVETPQLELPREWPGYPERGLLPSGTTTAVEESIRGFRRALKAILALAESEERLRRIASEVEKTRRRVNALEYIVIPRMKATIKYIRMRLEEYAREDFIRMKRIKALLKEKKAAA
jgi:V/A-type H+-transporting ATPase subunit D